MKPLIAAPRPLPRIARQTAGFTLMELMITVAIVGILAAIAYPSYQDSVRKSRRGDAKAALLENAAFMERYYSTNFRYTATDGTAGCPTLPVQCLPREVASASCGTDSSVYYTIVSTIPSTSTSTCATTGNTFSLTAIPAGAQAGDVCLNLTVDQTGARTTSSTRTDCW